MTVSKPISFVNLIDRQDMVPVVAKWYYDEWGKSQPDNSYEITLAKVEAQMNRECVPLHILAMQDGNIVGVAQLKMQEMKTYPEDTHWLGGVFVPPEARGRGVGIALVLEIIRIAKAFKVTKLYLQTEQFDGGIYLKAGFTAVERVVYKGIDVLVMRLPLT